MEFFTKETYQQYEQEAIRLRRLFHEIPELSEREEKTCEKIIEILQSYGITHIQKMFTTGVVAVLGDPNKNCIALRMDTDGLPVAEETGVCYQSKTPGMMHACGHDAHIAILLVTAKILKEREDTLPCSVKLIFQPAEEGDGGALPMISEGVLKNPKVSRIYGAHVWPGVPLGTLEYVEGAAFSGCDRYEIRLTGKGGHGAMPNEANPPLCAMAECILALQKLHNEERSAVISACACHADGYYNVFPSQARILGTIRTLTNEDRNRIFEKISALCDTLSQKTGIGMEFLPVEEYPPCYNDADALSDYLIAAEKAVGKGNVRQGNFTYTAEDFAYFAKNCPSAHIRIGCTDREETSYPLHHPKFQIAEQCLMHGVTLFCHAVWNEK